MPRIKRWFPVSHDINSDHEVWDMTDGLGERSLRIWLEFLSIADRNDGAIPPWSDGFGKAIAFKCHTNASKVRQVYDYVAAVKWLLCDPLPRLRNYPKYHINRVDNQIPRGNRAASLPSEPSEPSEPNKNKNKSPEPEKSGSAVTKAWPPEDVWLKELISEQTFLNNSNGALHDFAWWEDVARALGGIERPFIERQFAKMSAWLRENPGRRPTARGARRFVRSWLERAKEQERRLYAIKR